MMCVVRAYNIQLQRTSKNVVSVIFFPRYLNSCLATAFLWDASVCSRIDNLIQYYYVHTTQHTQSVS